MWDGFSLKFTLLSAEDGPGCSTVVANEIPKIHSEASRRVLQKGCMIYNCINTAAGASIQCASHSTTGLQGPFVQSRVIFGISLATTVVA